MKEKSNCCNAPLERDLGGVGVFSLTSGALICTKCRKYCAYGRVITNNSYCDQCTLNNPHTHSAFKVITENQKLDKHDEIGEHCGLLDCQKTHNLHDRNFCERCSPKVEGALTPLGEMVQTKSIEKAYPEAYRLARRFHELYELSAPAFGYKTKEETKEFDPESANGRLMAWVCFEIVKEELNKHGVEID